MWIYPRQLRSKNCITMLFSYAPIHFFMSWRRRKVAWCSYRGKKGRGLTRFERLTLWRFAPKCEKIFPSRPYGNLISDISFWQSLRQLWPFRLPRNVETWGSTLEPSWSWNNRRIRTHTYVTPFSRFQNLTERIHYACHLNQFESMVYWCICLLSSSTMCFDVNLKK